MLNIKPRSIHDFRHERYVNVREKRLNGDTLIQKSRGLYCINLRFL